MTEKSNEKMSFGDWLATGIGKVLAWITLLLMAPWFIGWFMNYADWVKTFF